ncbi:sensor histidine kinase [Kutzneria sp. CA-103260]|uniref:sensor histidine kinase n=1 Tax=Kutzneria sp. CA-103260 TaxID=2802641 RepID=UPI001BEE9A6F|nr:sensor histidine kinase [Kutzneria sp. CA-103260]QUQ62824.1 two-component system sensor kinase [Kutzneria sp. CA-103260]
MDERMGSGWPLRRWYLAVVVVMVLVVAAAVGVGAWALHSLTEARSLMVDQVDPASRQALALSNALVDEETGVRGYVLTGRADFLQPYQQGQQQEAQAVQALRGLQTGDLASANAALDAVQRAADAWRSQYATLALQHVNAGDIDRGKTLFDQVRAALTAQEAQLTSARAAGRTVLDSASTNLIVVGIVVAVMLLVLIVVLALLAHYGVVRPVSKLAAEVRLVADGQFQRPVAGSGPREIVSLAADVDQMRLHIMDELETHMRMHDELARSNRELEQFAYVASHDLQEPLRKVASFCQLLERRYQGQLDDRADQYIHFAVDGAKRMQVLINDLLAFSRVGRLTREQLVVDCGALVAQATANLATIVEETGAEITAGPLPSVRGEPALLTAVFQNLIGNAVKFHGDEPPRVALSAERDGELWTFTCADNGIGIEPEYSERVFVIFQRLHPKDAYPGTGIGLAMCRKIIEYHGGRIWLDTDAGRGTTFRFTLPVVEEEP